MKKKRDSFNMRLKMIAGLVLAFIGVFVVYGLFTGAFAPEGVIGMIAVAPVAWMIDGKFKELTAEELKGKTAEELAGYYNAYNDHKAAEFAKLIESKATKEDLEAMSKEIQLIQKQQLKSLNDALAAQGLMIKKLTEGERKQGAKTLSEQIREGLTANLEGLKKLKQKDQSGQFEFEIDTKVVGTMTMAGNVTGQIPVADMESGLNVIATRRPFILSLIQRGTTQSNLVQWIEQQNREGGAGATTEGSLKNQADFDLVLASEGVVKRTVYIKVSMEMLEDIDFIESEIKTELLKLMDLDIDNQILNGAGGGDVQGLITYATAYAAGSFANTIEAANNYDVLRTAINQVVVANFNPTVIVMHPSDVTAMELVKGSDDHYVLPPFLASNGMQISGIRIVENTGITVDHFLVMDGSKAKAFFKKGVTLSTGLENDDFTRNLITILAEARLLLRIKGNDVGAFVEGDFTSAKAALETP